LSFSSPRPSPLQARFGIEAVVVTTMQAISGAAYPGTPALDVTDNVIPFMHAELLVAEGYVKRR
jgi:aspartate-semialdehyde dehydrogenase